jgi:hypothetical protein
MLNYVIIFVLYLNAAVDHVQHCYPCAAGQGVCALEPLPQAQRRARSGTIPALETIYVVSFVYECF